MRERNTILLINSTGDHHSYSSANDSFKIFSTEKVHDLCVEMYDSDFTIRVLYTALILAIIFCMPYRNVLRAKLSCFLSSNFYVLYNITKPTQNISNRRKAMERVHEGYILFYLYIKIY